MSIKHTAEMEPRLAAHLAPGYYFDSSNGSDSMNDDAWVGPYDTLAEALANATKEA